MVSMFYKFIYINQSAATISISLKSEMTTYVKIIIIANLSIPLAVKGKITQPVCSENNGFSPFFNFLFYLCLHFCNFDLCPFPQTQIGKNCKGMCIQRYWRFNTSEQ